MRLERCSWSGLWIQWARKLRCGMPSTHSAPDAHFVPPPTSLAPKWPAESSLLTLPRGDLVSTQARSAEPMPLSIAPCWRKPSFIPRGLRGTRLIASICVEALCHRIADRCTQDRNPRTVKLRPRSNDPTTSLPDIQHTAYPNSNPHEQSTPYSRRPSSASKKSMKTSRF
jgi:hypothetical protein